MAIRKLWLLGILSIVLSFTVVAASSTPESSRIQSLLKPQEYMALVQHNETLITTELSKNPDRPFLEGYRADAAITAEAPVSITRRILTRYEIYEKLIPFIDHIKVLDDPSKVALEGGIFGWKMISLIQFQDKDPGWVHFVITQGSFAGMQGDFYFEEKPGQNDASLVYFHAQHTAQHFPPQFIMKLGAKIILSITASRMQKYIEEEVEERMNNNEVKTSEKPEAAR